MISKRSSIKLVAAAIIVLIGAVYWYFSEYRTGPIEAVQQSISVPR